MTDSQGGRDIRVIEYSGCCYAHEPREFYLEGVNHVVKRVVRSYIEQREGSQRSTRSVWLVVDELGRNFELTYHWVEDFWEVRKAPRR